MARRKSRRGEAGAGAAPMLRPLRQIRDYAIGATDGDVGEVTDVYFDDHSWTVRYLVVDTGTWLPGRQVLISPSAIARVDAAGQRLVTTLSRDRIKDSPGIDEAKPVSRQLEISFYGYYGYPFYWTGPYRWGATPYPLLGMPPMPPRSSAAEETAARAREAGDPSLRSANEVAGYGISATDGDLGHVEDYLIDEASWAIRYLVIDPRNWWPGAHVIIPAEWIERVDWHAGKVAVNVTRQQVKDAPEYRPAPTLGRDYEMLLYGHYGRPGYWDRAPEQWRIWPPAA